MRIDDEDDNDSAPWRAEDDFRDEYPDNADLDGEPGTVPCVQCRRSIHEDADLCPYCRHWQTDGPHTSQKPMWIIVTAILLLAALSGVLWIVLDLVGRGRS